MLCLSQNIWYMGKVGSIDSSFSVSKGIIAMREKAVLGHALIHPRGKGWPVLVLGKDIDKYFSNKQISYCEMLEQVVNEVKFFIHYQKEENYITKVVSCHGVLNWVEDHQTL